MDKYSESDMLDLLQKKYTSIRRGTSADRYVRARHARMPHENPAYGTGFARSIADYIVWDTYSPVQLIGHEVKVSRSDWLTELRNPEKSEAWRRYCHKWYLVVPDKSIVNDDLPSGWGLMTICSDGKLRVTTPSSIQDPEILPMVCQSQLGRSIAKTACIENTIDHTAP